MTDINNRSSKGFKITVKDVAQENTSLANESISAKRLGEKIAEFISNHLGSGKDIQVSLRVENWDETYDIEDSQFEINANIHSIGANDYQKNTGSAN